jgi:hypothetical protein
MSFESLRQIALDHPVVLAAPLAAVVTWVLLTLT